jgi:hypothetical protein
LISIKQRPFGRCKRIVAALNLFSYRQIFGRKRLKLRPALGITIAQKIKAFITRSGQTRKPCLAFGATGSRAITLADCRQRARSSVSAPGAERA